MSPSRGRPPGKLTIRRRQVLQFVERRGSYTLGELVRCCGLHDRSAAKRILKELRLMGMIG